MVPPRTPPAPSAAASESPPSFNGHYGANGVHGVNGVYSFNGASPTSPVLSDGCALLLGC